MSHLPQERKFSSLENFKKRFYGQFKNTSHKCTHPATYMHFPHSKLFIRILDTVAAATSLASTASLNGHPKFGFSLLNVLSHSSVHTHFCLFASKRVRGSAMDEKFLRTSCSIQPMPRNRISCLFLSGTGNLEMASTLASIDFIFP